MLKCNLAPDEDLFYWYFLRMANLKTVIFSSLSNHTFAFNYAVSLIACEASASQRSLSYRVVILIIKPPRCTNFSKLFLEEVLRVSYSSSVHHKEFFTVHTAMAYVIQVCWQLASRIRTFRPDPARILVYIVGFIIRIYHDARSPERQML